MDRSQPPIFLVGAPRSGTTLLAAMVASHPSLSCGPETAFFAHLAKTDGRRLVRRASWPRAAVDFLAALDQEGESPLERYGTDAATFERRLAGRPASIAGVLAALAELHMERFGKRRWAEKSPIHLLYLRELRRHFPEAPVVRIVRDPRDVARSLTRVPWGPDTFVEGLLYWRRFDDASRSFFAADRRSWTLRYEDLVASPEAELRRLCDFLGESFAAGMLSPEAAAPRVTREHEVWKERVGAPLDPDRAGGWRRLREEDLRAAELLVGDRLAAYRYPRAGVAVRGAEMDAGGLVLAHPRHEALARSPEALGWLLGRAARVWPRRRGERAVAALFVGTPDADRWLGRRSGERAVTALRLAWRAVRLRATGRPVVWLGRRREIPGGLAASALSFLLAGLASRRLPEAGETGKVAGDGG